MQERLIKDLKPHPQNNLIYGDSFDDDLLNSILKYGMDTPIKITPDGTIISGHRRYCVCKKLKHETIPIQEISETDPDKLLELLIANNVQRVKSKEMITREYKVLKSIEEKRAKERQTRKPVDSVKENLPEQKKGQSRDKAAAKVGWSGKTAEQAEQVIDHIDNIKESDPEKAEELTKDLNKSVSGAVKKIKPKIIPKTNVKQSEYIDESTEAMQFAVIAISQLGRIRKEDPKKDEALDRVITWIDGFRFKPLNGKNFKKKTPCNNCKYSDKPKELCCYLAMTGKPGKMIPVDQAALDCPLEKIKVK